MFDFLDTARQLLRSDRVKDAKESFERVFRAISTLQRVHSKSQLDTNNIEEVFAVFEMAQITGALPDHSEKDVVALLSAVRVLIARTIEETLQFQQLRGNREPPQPYAQFVDILLRLRDQTTPVEDSCVITFNYDLALDFALTRRGVKVSYALDGTESGDYTSYSSFTVH